MSSGSPRWGELLSALGRSAVVMARSEATALGEDLAGSGKTLGKALVVALCCLFALFWALGALILLAVELLTIYLPRWGAVAVALGLLLVVALALGLVAWRLIARLETPKDMVRRRLANQQSWWSTRIAAAGRAPGRDEEVERP